MSHWENLKNESLYDKTLLHLEIQEIASHIKGPLVCDFGCGDGEATQEYARVGQVSSELGNGFSVEGFDVVDARLEVASKRGLKVSKRSILSGVGDLKERYDTVISQRLLINLHTSTEQKIGFLHLAQMVKPGGRLILSEGSYDGVRELNLLRATFGLPGIGVPPHNLFIWDAWMETLLPDWDVTVKTFGAYFLLTRGVQPALTQDFHWASDFNKASAKVKFKADQFSRIKVWIFDAPR